MSRTTEQSLAETLHHQRGHPQVEGSASAEVVNACEDCQEAVRLLWPAVRAERRDGQRAVLAGMADAIERQALHEGAKTGQDPDPARLRDVRHLRAAARRVSPFAYDGYLNPADPTVLAAMQAGGRNATHNIANTIGMSIAHERLDGTNVGAVVRAIRARSAEEFTEALRYPHRALEDVGEVGWLHGATRAVHLGRAAEHVDHFVRKVEGGWTRLPVGDHPEWREADNPEAVFRPLNATTLGLLVIEALKTSMGTLDGDRIGVSNTSSDSMTLRHGTRGPDLSLVIEPYDPLDAGYTEAWFRFPEKDRVRLLAWLVGSLLGSQRQRS